MKSKGKWVKWRYRSLPFPFLFIPPSSSSAEYRSWEYLGEYYASRTSVSAWKSDPTRGNLEFIGSRRYSFLGIPAADWQMPGFAEQRIHPVDRKDFIAFLQNTARKTGPRCHRYRILTDGNETKWIREIHCMRSDKRGKKFVCGLFVDVSPEQQLGEDIRYAADFERKCIESDLHDDLCRPLTELADLAKQLEARLREGVSRHTGTARSITREIESALEQVRLYSRDPSNLDAEEPGLTVLLRDLARETQARFNVECRTRLDDSIEIEHPEIRRHLLRIAQEAIRNAIRHGEAARITIILQREGECISSLLIEDEGCGFPEAPQPAEGLGIRLMKHRCRQFGASLSIAPARGRDPGGSTATAELRNRGTVVKCTFFQSITPFHDEEGVVD